MDIIIYYVVNLNRSGVLQAGDIDSIRRANALLAPHEHAPDCPVRAGASIDCVWPHAVCLSARYTEVYNIDHNPPSKRSPSDAPPATIVCPACEGASPTQEQMSQQMAATGDTSGACGTCDNTHVVPAPAPRDGLMRWQWVGRCGKAENIRDGNTVMVGVGKPCACGDPRCIAQAMPVPGDIR